MKKRSKVIITIIAIVVIVSILFMAFAATTVTATGVLLFTPAGKFIATATKNTADALFSDTDTKAETSEPPATPHPWKHQYGKEYAT